MTTTAMVARVPQVPEFEPGDAEMLARVVPLYNRLDRPLKPIERHEIYRELASIYFVMGTRMIGKGWDLVFQIEADGSWKLETEVSTDTGEVRQKYQHFVD